LKSYKFILCFCICLANYLVSAQENNFMIYDQAILGSRLGFKMVPIRLATACSILPIKEAKQLAISNQAALLITTIKNGKLVFEATSNFKNYWQTTNIIQGKK